MDAEKKRARKVLRSHERKLDNSLKTMGESNPQLLETLVKNLSPIKKMRKSTEVCDTHLDALPDNEKALMYELVDILVLIKEGNDTGEERNARIIRYFECLEEFEELYNERRGAEPPQNELENADTDTE
ncbi:hypothetical protein CAEBREN_19344 [Caenorhabditis brenneri]|uniref:Uncharacterized protein n=1 Tax=Caenorhabditis brenneri TaxID=135651 RepID=G0P0R5_CAEBE|nr:hypothetical protein CAEBREN_19344 [Caenorhabditis brenneri]